METNERHLAFNREGYIVTEPEQDEEHTEDKAKASTPQLDRLERLAKAATTNAQAKQWRARKNGLQDQPEPSEVRSLTHDAEARAQAEAAMRLMAAAKPKRNPRRW
jgi:hypothetical protein